MQNQETFLLVMPDYSDFPNLFMKNLEKLNFKTDLITDKLPDFRYQGKEKLQNFFRKTFLQDKNFKKNLITSYRQNEFLKIANELNENFDYILVIRPDLFPIPFIKKLKERTSMLIAYQWDGIEKFPEIKNYFSLFDSFFCFETVNGVENIKKTTNFYFDFDNFDSNKSNIQNEPPVFYFVGLDWENRREKINKFVDFAIENNIALDFYLQEFEKNNNKNANIKYLKNRISFAENIELVKRSDILLDFVDPRQVGLSIRFFEAMYYHKKVITDNEMVKNYDFYHPDNIFVIENDNYNSISEFIKKPYHNLPEEIVKKYGFSQWIKRIINK